MSRYLSIVFGFLAAIGWVSTVGASADPLAEKLERERRTLEELKDRIQEKRKRAGEAERKRESVLQSIESLDEELALHRQDHREINKKLQRRDQDVQEITDQLTGIRNSIHERREAILARLRAQYMEGRFGYVKALLTSNSYGDFQRRGQYLSAVSQKDFELMETFRTDIVKMEQAERQRGEARAGLVVFKQTIEKELHNIRALQREKMVYLAKITRERDAYDRMVEELERSASRVDSLVHELETRRRATAMHPSTSPSFSHGSKGSLPWPAEGKVVSFFGRQKHPTFNTYIQRKGIEIKTSEGSIIHAVMPGTVVYADWLKGYGLVIILDHTNGFFSLYAHASKILTRVGEQVLESQSIGETGDTGMIGENTLYFELREGSEPVDPLHWLAKR